MMMKQQEISLKPLKRELQNFFEGFIFYPPHKKVGGGGHVPPVRHRSTPMIERITGFEVKVSFESWIHPHIESAKYREY